MSGGRRGPSPLTGKRELYRQLMERGMDNSAACRVVGINRRTGTRWRFGRKYTNRVGEQWEYPPVAVPPPPGATTRTRFLSEHERLMIADYLHEDVTLTEIAHRLKRSTATISREVIRNADPDTGVYRPHAAHAAALERRRRGRELKLVEGGELHRFVADRLAKRWSPEQISHATVEAFADRPEMRVCPETIYQEIYRPTSSLRGCSPRPFITARFNSASWRTKSPSQCPTSSRCSTAAGRSWIGVIGSTNRLVRCAGSRRGSRRIRAQRVEHRG